MSTRGYPTPFGPAADAWIETNALAYDAILPGLGDLLRDLWFTIAGSLCDCESSGCHRWNCTLTPIWAQTMRDLNPWIVVRCHQPNPYPYMPTGSEQSDDTGRA